MKLLLTSAGIRNESIRKALLDLLGKPVEASSALCIPTASHANPGGAAQAWGFVAGREPECPMVGLGWKSVGLLELTALPSLARPHWEPWLRAADVLLVNGGDPLYLHHWMRRSGLADLLSDLPHLVWLGLSAGSMVLTPRIGQEFIGWTPPEDRDDRTLGIVDFSIFPHLDHPMLPENTLENARKWAGKLPHLAYAIDDETAIKVQDGRVEVISEGRWTQFDPPS
jgi:dipeptidase E